MRFVPVKNIEQQAILSVHRARQGFVKARTAQANQIRGVLSEFGIVIPQGIHSIAKWIPDILEDAENRLPGTMRHLLERLSDHLKELNRQVEELELQIRLVALFLQPISQRLHRHFKTFAKAMLKLIVELIVIKFNEMQK